MRDDKSANIVKLETSDRSRQQLEQSLVHGFAWSGLIKWTSQIVSWASTFVVAHFLSPSDYGLVSIAAVYLGLLTLIGEFGVGTTVITLRNLSEEQIAQLNGLALITGVVGFLGSCVLAVPLSMFFHFSGFRMVFIVMSIVFIISSLQSVPSALLQRELRFKATALIDGARSAILALFSVSLAVAGFRYWTLVFSTLLGACLSTGLTLRLRNHRFAWPRLRSLRSALKFSGDIVGARVAWYCYSNADFIVAGRFLGQSELGTYTFAWTLAHLPLERITGLLNTVMPAFFSAIQDDLASLRKYVLNVTQALALVTFPAAVGISLVASDFVHSALGPRWEGAIVPLELLAIYGAIRTVDSLLPFVLIVTGDTRRFLWLSLMNLIVLPPAFYFGSRWGAPGIAAAWLVLYPVLSVPLFWLALRKIQISGREYWRTICPPVVGVAFMVLAVSAIKAVLPISGHIWWRLGAEVLSGAIVYSGSMFLLFKDMLWAALRRIQTAVG
jgi:O-antigen/teichoic acid export membrane protein